MSDFPVSVEHLIAILRDGEKGFLELSEHVQCPEYRLSFLEEACVRASYAAELEAELQQTAEINAFETGTTLGMMHRRWIELKSGLGAGDQAILKTTDQCERIAIKTYEDVLENQTLPDAIRMKVEVQVVHVRRFYYLLSNLRGTTKT